MSSNMKGLNSKIPYVNQIKSVYAVQRFIMLGVREFYIHGALKSKKLTHP
jgi:hypothetical protein